MFILIDGERHNLAKFDRYAKLRKGIAFYKRGTGPSAILNFSSVKERDAVLANLDNLALIKI